MWYHDSSNAYDFGHDAAAQLTEWTMRDPLQPRSRYQVVLEVEVDHQSWAKTWTFTTQ